MDELNAFSSINVDTFGHFWRKKPIRYEKRPNNPYFFQNIFSLK